MLNIKNIIKLQKSKKERINKNIIIVEGCQEIKMAFKSNLKLKKVFICNKIYKKKETQFCILQKFIVFINKINYNKVAYRKNSEGILGIFFKKKINYEKKFINLINKKKDIFFLIIDNIEKPGNLGAIIRTLECTNVVDSIIIKDNKDIYNPNIIRASLGSVFIFPILILPFNKILKYLLKKNILLLGTSIQKKNNLSLYKFNFNYYKKIAIIFGNEHTGVSKKWKTYKNIHIPMYGIINSLNVSVAVSIIIFEIMRQKKFFI
ncbi:MAG: RNA methyltransferase [Candidatus Shikimatogenerans bostrichidophilus]|nr:MAG: RNA methyltransferase [Candidatus Shikimatogenerans bostrichidophilus]